MDIFVSGKSQGKPREYNVVLLRTLIEYIYEYLDPSGWFYEKPLEYKMVLGQTLGVGSCLHS